jgi:hypothetical protein
VNRRLVTFAAIASLLLCVATVALWVRSYWRLDGIVHYRLGDERDRGWSIQSVVGETRAPRRTAARSAALSRRRTGSDAPRRSRRACNGPL